MKTPFPAHTPRVEAIEMKKKARQTITAAAWMLAALFMIGSAVAVGSAMAQAPSAPAAVTAPPSVEASPESEGLIPTQNLWQIMQSGGILMYPIALCSLLLVAFVFERAISLRPRRIIPKAFVTRFLQQMRDGELDRDQALTLCEENGSPVSEVFAGAVRKWGCPAVEVEQSIIDSGERVTNGLRRYLRVLNGIQTIAPLLGLLGTVFGMIRAFNAIAGSEALGRPELLARGISEALLTTAAGLTVAIPALFFYLYFLSRVDRLIIDIDGLSQELVPLVSAEEIAAKPKRGK
jgi:biopolymer transport protein ExbB